MYLLLGDQIRARSASVIVPAIRACAAPNRPPDIWGWAAAVTTVGTGALVSVSLVCCTRVDAALVSTFVLVMPVVPPAPSPPTIVDVGTLTPSVAVAEVTSRLPSVTVPANGLVFVVMVALAL